jgi:hypothetical protein
MSSLDTLDLQFESLRLYVINNYGQSLVPVIQVIMESIEIKRLVTFKKSITECSFAALLNYYNGRILKWEPFMEKAPIGINYSSYIGERLKQILTLENQTEQLFNISR